MKKTTIYNRLFFAVCFFLILFSSGNTFAKSFTVVIDAGHGGKDTGAVGKYSKEKNLNLDISLLLGKMIEENNPDVKVVYTRKTDVFLPLQERADIVNKNNADIFFCIHTNSTKSSSARGAETFTLRVNSDRTRGNLDVAMRENSVMLLEDDYKTRYQGFDPRSIDSYIMFDFMQDKYLDKSVELASAIQKQFVRIGQYDRGVQQAGFWVLYQSACPSVLVETGFISNRDEENYLNSTEGQKEIASAIYNAFQSYKKDQDKKLGKTSNVKNQNTYQTAEIDSPSEKDSVTESNNPQKNTVKKSETKSTPTINSSSNGNQTVYKLQILASNSKLDENSPKFKGLKNVQNYYENGLYKYTYGECSSSQEASELRKKIVKQFPHAFVIKIKDGKRVYD